MLYIIIFVVALIGAFVNGIVGFVIGGFLCWVVIEVIGFFVRSKGAVPKKIKDETATDFIVKNPDLIKRTYPTSTPYEAKQHVSALIEKMVERTWSNNPPSQTAAGIMNPEVFFYSARAVADEQPSETLKELARELIKFFSQHSQWYG